MAASARRNVERVPVGMPSLLFSFNGRINRAQYWLGATLIMVLGFSGFFLAFVLAGVSISPKDGMAGNAILGILLMIPVWAFMQWAGFAVQVKRLHDRGRTGYWSLLPIGVMMLALFSAGGAIMSGQVDAASAAITPFGLLLWLINLAFFIDLGCLGSKEGSNKYGDPPGSPRNAGPTQTSQNTATETVSIPGITLASAQSAMDRAIEEQRRAAQTPQRSAPAHALSAAPSAARAFGRRAPAR